eukprot:403370820
MSHTQKQITLVGPLWLNEIKKQTPPPNQYYYKSDCFSDYTQIAKTKPNKCLFGESYDRFRKTADIQKGVKVYDHSQYNVNATKYSPNHSLSRKQIPTFTIGYEQHELFQDQIQRSSQTPGPDNYNSQQNDKIQKSQRFSSISFGKDIKSTLKPIKFAPGPGHYDTEHLTSMSTKINQKNSKNIFKMFLDNYKKQGGINIESRESSSYLGKKYTSFDDDDSPRILNNISIRDQAQNNENPQKIKQSELVLQSNQFMAISKDPTKTIKNKQNQYDQDIQKSVGFQTIQPSKQRAAKSIIIDKKKKRKTHANFI